MKDEEVVRNGAIENATKNANTKSNVTQEYKRDLFEDTKELERYKDKIYDDGIIKSIKSDYDGAELHKSHKKAANKYGSRKSYHQAEVDHVVPVKHVHNFAKNMNYVSDEDVRKVINQEKNFKIIDKHLNASKHELSNFEYVKKHPELLTEVKMKMIRDGIKSSSYVYRDLLYKDLKNATIDTVKNTELLSDIATTSASIQLAKIITEEKSVSEAIVDTTKMTIKGEIIAIVTTQSMEIAQIATKTIQSEFEKKASEELLSKAVNDVVNDSIDFINKNMGDIVTYSTRVINLYEEYLQGNINEEIIVVEAANEAINQFAIKFGKIMGKSIGQMAIPISALGNIIGEVVGGCIGYIVGETITSATKGYIEEVELEKERIRKITKYTNEALTKLENNRKSTEEMVCENAEYWNNILGRDINELEKSLSENNPENVAELIDRILVAFEKKCRFATIKEFDDFFNDDNQIFVL